MVLSANLYSQGTRALNDDLFTTTILNYRKTLVDQVFDDFVTWFWLREMGRIAMLDGGERIAEQLIFKANDTAKFYTMFETIDVTPVNPLTTALFEWKEAAVNIAIARKEERQNSTEHAIIKLLDARLMNARMSLTNIMSEALYATTQANEKSESLDILIDATSTVGLIDRTGAGNAFWQATVTASGSFAGQGLSDMRTLYNGVSSSAGKDSPDFIVSTQTIYESYEAELQPQMMFADAKLADAGFETLRFKGANFVYDGNVPSGVLYMLNSQYLTLNVDIESDFVVSPFVKPANQPGGRYAQILWMGNVTTSRPGRMGKLTGITA